MIVHTASYLPKQSAKSFVTMASDEIVAEKAPAPAPAPAKAANKDDLLLAELGYKQEFKREFSVFSCICFAFSISKPDPASTKCRMSKLTPPARPPRARSGSDRVRLVDGRVWPVRRRPRRLRVGLVHPRLLCDPDRTLPGRAVQRDAHREPASFATQFSLPLAPPLTPRPWSSVRRAVLLVLEPRARGLVGVLELDDGLLQRVRTK